MNKPRDSIDPEPSPPAAEARPRTLAPPPSIPRPNPSVRPPPRPSAKPPPLPPPSKPQTLAPPAAVPRPRSAPPPLPSTPPPLPSSPTPGPPPLPALADFGDDDMDEITIVGRMSDEVKALRQGYRKVVPPAAIDPPDIEITSDVELDALLLEELLEEGTPPPTRPVLSLAVAGDTHVGRKRKINEDRILLLGDHAVYAIADGMGGHASGEVAAEMALQVVEFAMRENRFEGDPHLLWPSDGDELARSIEAANRAVNAAAESDPALDGMGTTMTAIRFSPARGRAYVAHVGDSPCFRIRPHEIVQLTRDHTMANLVGMTGPMANYLSRAVGTEPQVEVDLDVDVPEDGDVYLLSSDGLTKMLEPAEIGGIVLAQPDLAACVQTLIDEANARGGKDNIAVILIRVSRVA